MSTIRPTIAASAALAAVIAGGVAFWRRHPRAGTRFMNSVVNPAVLRGGVTGGRASEIGILEHVGRRSGIARMTPVHPEPTSRGFRVMVPLGHHSEWARNVIAEGRCRLRLHDRVYDLDQPALIPAAEVDDLPPVVRRVMTNLGFEYLTLRASPNAAAA